MERRKFLLNGFGITAGALVIPRLLMGMNPTADGFTHNDIPAIPQVLIDRRISRYSHRLPVDDQNYKRSKNYIEDDPVPEYNWASDEAYEAFQDMKYGVRIHWGLYSIWNLSGESWPFLGNRNPDIDSAAKGGNFMVGIGPDENGVFSPLALQQLREVGKWLASRGESIYATRAREGDLWHEGDNVRFTRSKDHKVIYAHCFEWPAEKLVLKTVKPEDKTRISLMGKNKVQLQWKYDETSGLVISIPGNLRKQIPEEERLAFAFSIEL